MPSVIDLYSGAGGFGLGSELAGFNSIAAIDVDETLQSAYKLNFPNTRTITGDVASIEHEGWQLILNGREVDGVIGGPPCQSFSRIGKRDQNDPRRTLLHHYFRSILSIQPKFFVMENVEGILDDGNIQLLNDCIDIVSATYQIVGPMVLDASDYGAPTKRKRVFIVGYKQEHFNPFDNSIFVPANTPKTNVRQAIADLPEPIKQMDKKTDFNWCSYRTNRISNYARRMRSLPPEALGTRVAREKLVEGKVSGLAETCHTTAVQKRFKNTKAGSVESVSRYPRLDWSGFCPTLRAGTGSDKGNFQAMRPIHPEAPRVITVREAARLQGFPDWFLFHPTKHHSFRMIGNSVSPIISEAIMRIIRGKMIECEDRDVQNLNEG